MNDQKYIKKLAELLGIKGEYFDESGQLKATRTYECTKFLKILGFNPDDIESIKNAIFEIEFSHWSRFVNKVLVIKENEIPVIKFRIPTKYSKIRYKWILEKESGETKSFDISIDDLKLDGYKYFRNEGTFSQYLLNLDFKLPLGYHSLKIVDELDNFSEMKIIVAPQKAYRPAIMSRKTELVGLSLDSSGSNNYNKFKINDNRVLRNIIKDVDTKKVDFIDIGLVNQINTSSFEKNISIPSSNHTFNTLFLNIPEVIKFVGDKSVFFKYNTENYPTNTWGDILSAKLNILKSVFQSFKENHLNKHTLKAYDFYEYLRSKDSNFKKQALFRAVDNYLKTDQKVVSSWHDWPESFKCINSSALSNFKKNNIESIQFFEFVQWQEELQLKQAGDLSLKSKLNVGLCTTFNHIVDNKGSQSWSDNHLYAYNALVFDKNSEFISDFSPVLPYALKDDGYESLISGLRSNFKYSGAVRMVDIDKYFSQKWYYKYDKDFTGVYVYYDFDDILSIIALESVRNQTLIVIDDFDSLNPQIKHFITKYNFLPSTKFRSVAIKNEIELKKYYKQPFKLQPVTQNAVLKIPNSTYRLQLNKKFTFLQAKEIIPYLKELGITHCYISPILKARSSSDHCYDIVNHYEFHEDLGTKQDFYDFSDTLHSYGLGLICDIVPNHMGVNSENIWWMDVLENGEASEFAHYFDIDWAPFKKELKSKVLLPVLGDHYGNILTNGNLELKLNPSNSKIELFYYDNKFPVNPSSYPLIMEHRLDILSSRLGGSNSDFLEYQSIITAFNNLPVHTQNSSEQIQIRKREKNITFYRLNNLIKKNYLIKEFIEENLEDFKTGNDNGLASQRLHNLLEQQVYRLAYWRVSVDEINYRRFFDVNDLAALRIQSPEVFSSTHNYIFDLIKDRKIDGLRIDHPDGLHNPSEYFYKLQSEIASMLDLEHNFSNTNCLSNENLPFYIIAEKILAPFEKLPSNWPIFGTVGYDFLNLVNNLMIKSDNLKKMTRVYESFIKTDINYQNLVISCKKLIMKTALTSELSMLANHLNKISESNYSTRDFTFNNIRDALMQVIANFPVYRTYISEDGFDNKVTEYVKWAVGLAKKQTPFADTFIYDFIEQILLLKFEDNKNSVLYKEILNFTMKFQQYTAPLMAKGYEDTIFYRYNRLISHNEVGSDLSRFGISKSEFHNINMERFKRIPFNLSNTSTHDTKRSEDVRARINILSEIPLLWKKHVDKWHSLNITKKHNIDGVLYPDLNDEYLFYQTLIGIWPDEEFDNIDMTALSTRVENYMLKVIRESKINTSWLSINEKYENALSSFVQKVLHSPLKHPFWKDFLPFQSEIASKGFINTITQTVLKLTLPGVPNIYQGCEVMNFTLVDPDNRRCVDFESLKLMLNVKEFDVSRKSASKMFVVKTLLKLRNEYPDIFKYGEYVPLDVKGVCKNNILAYGRVLNKSSIIVILPLFPYEINFEKDNFWGNTRVKFGKNARLYDVFNNFSIDVKNEIFINEVFVDKPFSVLKCIN